MNSPMVLSREATANGYVIQASPAAWRRETPELILQRDGWILIAWMRRAGETWAFWIAEKGPRWVYLGEGEAEDGSDVSCISGRCTRARAKRIYEDLSRSAELLRPIALPLFADGPDRRAAYLARKEQSE